MLHVQFKVFWESLDEKITFLEDLKKQNKKLYNLKI